ncbi:hypothetical protein ALC57_17342 [Trachymyrmex cornetzi]|uniref:Uncharacterized protein n=1 Tax=Trachymyrmex cornetzi TaxID=471704 RepID=A0A195DCU9_9HYME|nr:hypothetical protein ALC57_17342 [Trachymyrmex cornetzi]
MRKVKGYQRRDVGVLREQSGRLPVTSNDSQFTMFTKRERAIAVQLTGGESARRFNIPARNLTQMLGKNPNTPRAKMSHRSRSRCYATKVRWKMTFLLLTLSSMTWHCTRDRLSGEASVVLVPLLVRSREGGSEREREREREREKEMDKQRGKCRFSEVSGPAPGKRN